MTATQTFAGVLTLVDCPACGVTFGITAAFEARRREDHRFFYCPNQHHMNYGESAKEIELRQAKANLDWYQNRSDRYKAEAEFAQRSAAAIRGVVTKIKKRVSKGVCPCCNRHFADLHRHMQGQHPEWQAEA